MVLSSACFEAIAVPYYNFFGETRRKIFTDLEEQDLNDLLALLKKRNASILKNVVFPEPHHTFEED